MQHDQIDLTKYATLVKSLLDAFDWHRMPEGGPEKCLEGIGIVKSPVAFTSMKIRGFSVVGVRVLDATGYVDLYFLDVGRQFHPLGQRRWENEKEGRNANA